MERTESTYALRTLSTPKIALFRIGKKAPKKIIANIDIRMLFKIRKLGCVIEIPNRDAMLVIPNHANTNGTHAIGGTDRKKLKNGSNIRLAMRLYPMSIPSGTATSAAVV